MTSADSGPIAGLSEIAHRYDVILSDVWGVLHNGVSAYASAGAALAQYRRDGGKVVLITNAPRPSAPIIAMIDHLGVPREAWDSMVSSGDCTREMIAPYRGKVIHHVGPATTDNGLYEGLDVTRGPAEIAEAIVATDMDDDEETPETYLPRMRLWLERGLPLICANPDKVVEIGDRLYYCAGALADLYAEMGGQVLMAGKPYTPIYDDALRLAEEAVGHPVPRERILAIGDSVRTDAMGAAAFDIDLLFITGSVHAEELDAFGSPDPAAVRALVAPSHARLAGFMPRLA